MAIVMTLYSELLCPSWFHKSLSGPHRQFKVFQKKKTKNFPWSPFKQLAWSFFKSILVSNYIHRNKRSKVRKISNVSEGLSGWSFTVLRRRTSQGKEKRWQQNIETKTTTKERKDTDFRCGRYTCCLLTTNFIGMMMGWNTQQLVHQSSHHTCYGLIGVVLLFCIHASVLYCFSRFFLVGRLVGDFVIGFLHRLH